MGVDCVHNTWPIVSLMVKWLMKIDLDFHLLDESLEGRVDLGTSSQVTAFESQCSSKHLGHAEPLIAGCSALLPDKNEKINSELKTSKETKYI